jgi:hypothetical protein
MLVSFDLHFPREIRSFADVHVTKARWSTYREVGGWGKRYKDEPHEAGGSRQRLVALRNVCWSEAGRELLYFAHPNSLEKTLFSDQPGRNEHVSCLVDLHPQSQAYDDELECLSVNVVDGPTPRNAIWIDSKVATLQSMRQSDENFGHFLFDQMLHSFLLQWSWFGGASDDNQIAYVQVMPFKWVDTITPVFYDRQPLDLSATGNNLTCFDLVLAGAGAVAFNEFRTLRVSALSEFRNMAYRRLSIHDDPRQEHLILFYIKESDSSRARSIENGDELIKALDTELRRRSFLFRGVPTRMITGKIWEQGFEDELKILSRATVLITPPGGVSASAIFLRDPSAMILLDWWCTPENGVGQSCRFAKEANVWSKFPNRHVQYYSLDDDELTGTQGNKWSATGVYNLSAAKFVRAVLHSLDMVHDRIFERGLDPPLPSLTWLQQE